MLRRVMIGILCVGVISLVVFGGRYLYQTWKYKKIVSDIVIQEPDLSKLKDGEYEGTFDAIMVAADVKVIIEDNKIKDIVLERHYNDRGKSAEIITEKVVSAQSLKVDAISGATNSSKVILKAIDNALNKDTNEAN